MKKFAFKFLEAYKTISHLQGATLSSILFFLWEVLCCHIAKKKGQCKHPHFEQEGLADKCKPILSYHGSYLGQ